MPAKHPHEGLCRPQSGTQRPTHQDLQDIARDALHRLRYLCAAQWAHPDNESSQSPAAQALRQHFGRTSARQKAHLQAKAKAMTQPEVAPYLYGRYAQQKPESFLDDDAGHSLAQERSFSRKRMGLHPDRQSERINGQRVLEAWDQVEDPEPTALLEPQLPYLSFRIDKVRCIDETNPEWWGQDRIALAGLAVHPNGTRTPLMPKVLGTRFDDGDEEHYIPAWNLHAFDMRGAPSWQAGQKFLVALVLAEKDRGELHSILDATWQEVTQDVQNTLNHHMGPTMENYARPWMSGLVNAATAWVLSEFFGWLSQSFDDDIFAPGYCWMTMQEPNARFTRYGTWGSPRSPRLRAHFFGYGGHYAVDYHWTLHK